MPAPGGGRLRMVIREVFYTLSLSIYFRETMTTCCNCGEKNFECIRTNNIKMD